MAAVRLYRGPMLHAISLELLQLDAEARAAVERDWIATIQASVASHYNHYSQLTIELGLGLQATQAHASALLRSIVLHSPVPLRCAPPLRLRLWLFLYLACVCSCVCVRRAPWA
eukprot:4890624-Prymnesium_polylepis.1